MNLEVQISWPVQHVLNLDVHISWQARHFVLSHPHTHSHTHSRSQEVGLHCWMVSSDDGTLTVWRAGLVLKLSHGGLSLVFVARLHLNSSEGTVRK